ncbi:CHASE2 domain-containing serine/threonine-protein kinase [Anabaenopsis tanganyikae CS-531]|uniref:non-specific serine/threonine protein kinase n=2 Tax=Anabaenopsis TaxID=110103 RepID=A0ABT5AT18_9CYAN|nr:MULTISPECIES: CHASE2 domain-containing serine/threonine-protein kinase [Anabaenopsis]MDB9540054.1 CHASE2 domain-containing serine/threonine-protein kinase [Anabaenopsis arnoldii]MDH6092414.1 CHASE2 domain-containing serine/threonine-protein kinase [Anabaenopsis arnoldii]MDH6106403.1 CHASE2 domain-containing serine/threonine-protein kinase [Anabaenopsis tanganyikae CS-531]
MVDDSYLIKKITKFLVKILKYPVIIGTVIATVLILGLQKLQVLQVLELKVYDQMMQMRTDPGKDPRLLIVSITEEDLQRWGWPLSGEVLNQLLSKLEEHQPIAIGLDIFRDLPVQPGHEQLLQRLVRSDSIISICKHTNVREPGIAAPAGVKPGRVGFSDLVEDTDGLIRRNLIAVKVEKSDICQSSYSLSWRLALKYLALQGIPLQSNVNQELQLGDVIFTPLKSNSGGYQNADTRGYQILLNYRSPGNIAEKVTVTQVLAGKITPDLVKDRIVLIGSTAPSLKDIFNTPFNTGKADNSGRMAGVEIHGHMISQILSAVLNNQPLFWFLPGWVEVLWIGSWSVLGGYLARRLRYPFSLGLRSVASLLVLFVGNFVIFTHGGWFPVVAPALGLVVASVSVLAYSAHDSQREKKQIIQLLQAQKELIAELQKQQTTVTPTPEPDYLGKLLTTQTLLGKRYQIINNLGRGGFSETYLAQDIQRPGNPLCVVKQMRPVRQDKEYLNLVKRLFHTEADILEILGKHPQIPQLLAFFSENNNFYLVQEFIPGHTLKHELTSGICYLRSEVINILTEVLQILVFVHSYDVIHQDIKPSNLMRRTTDGHIVLIDFGGVKQLQAQNHVLDSIIFASRGYAPPEQMSGIPKLNSDIYALGIIAIQALTGLNPQEKEFGRDLKTGFIIIPAVSPSGEQTWQDWSELADTTEELTRILNKMVHLHSYQRYESAMQVLEDINNLLSKHSGSVRTPTL